jgi:hypothetical protein
MFVPEPETYAMLLAGLDLVAIRSVFVKLLRTTAADLQKYAEDDEHF